MRSILLLPLAALAGLTSLVLAAPAQALEPLDGWQKLKFAMTPDQVQAVKGMAWTDLVKLPMPGGISTMDSKKPVKAFGLKPTVRLTFDGASKLTTVDLVSTQSLAVAACDAMTRKVLAAAEEAYGPFAPDQRIFRSDSPGLTYETAGANSRLVVQTTDSQDTGKTVIAETRHAAGPASVQVSVNLNEPPITEDGQKQAHLCEMHVLFNAK